MANEIDLSACCGTGIKNIEIQIRGEFTDGTSFTITTPLIKTPYIEAPIRYRPHSICHT